MATSPSHHGHITAVTPTTTSPPSLSHHHYHQAMSPWDGVATSPPQHASPPQRASPEGFFFYIFFYNLLTIEPPARRRQWHCHHQHNHQHTIATSPPSPSPVATPPSHHGHITTHITVEFKWSTLKYTRLIRWLQIYESNIEEGGAGILVQVNGDPVPPTYYIYTTKRGYAYLC